MTDDNKTPSCEERISGRLGSRLESIGRLLGVAQATDLDEISDEELSEATNLAAPDRGDYEGERGLDELRDEAYERLNEMPLSVETFKVVKVLLSMGGPADWFEAQIDEDGDILRIEYVFQDWFDGARRALSGRDFDTAEQFIRQFIVE